MSGGWLGAIREMIPSSFVNVFTFWILHFFSCAYLLGIIRKAPICLVKNDHSIQNCAVNTDIFSIQFPSHLHRALQPALDSARESSFFRSESRIPLSFTRAKMKNLDRIISGGKIQIDTQTIQKLNKMMSIGPGCYNETLKCDNDDDCSAHNLRSLSSPIKIDFEPFLRVPSCSHVMYPTENRARSAQD
jgi:hypothetical protein